MTGVRPVPTSLRWLFWDVDVDQLDLDTHADYILPRVLERGGLDDVRWLLGEYGQDRIHAFLRDVGHPELSARTLAFWRAALHAEDEPWASAPGWRKSSDAPWPG